MGGDGGVVATDRRYMRGAGTADHTGDYEKHAATKFTAQEAMTTCTLTKSPLFSADSSSSPMIVADPYGQLYHKEAAIQSLLKRKQQGVSNNNTDSSTVCLGPQVRRLADLYDVRFHRENKSSSCPITGKALTGTIPAILLIPGKEGTPNVVSESALKQLSMEELQEEYGPIAKKVRLAPPPTLLEIVKEQVLKEQEKEEEERQAKKSKKKSKRKRGEDGDEDCRTDSKKDGKKAGKNGTPGHAPSSNTQRACTSTLGKQLRSRVDAAIQHNSVLSSIFSKASSNISDKEKKDNLFAR
jgi:hypothetical protein